LNLDETGEIMDNNSNPFKPAAEHSDKKQKLNKNTYFDYVAIEKDYDNLDEQFQSAISRSRHQRIKTYASERHSSARELNQRRKDVYQTNPNICTVSTGEIDTELINLSLESEKDLQNWRLIQQGMIDEICAEDEKGVPEVTTEVLPVLDEHYHEISRLFSAQTDQPAEAEHKASEREASGQPASESRDEEEDISPDDNLPEEVKEREAHDEFHERERELVDDFFNNIVIPENTFKKPPVYTPPESFDKGLISEEPIDNIEEIEAGLDGKEKPDTAELEKTRLFDVIARLEEDDSTSNDKAWEEPDSETSSFFDNLQQTDRIEPVRIDEISGQTAAVFEQAAAEDISEEPAVFTASEAEISQTPDAAAETFRTAPEPVSDAASAAAVKPPLRFFADIELRNSLIGLAVSLILVLAYVLVYRTSFTSSDWIILAVLGVGMVLTSDLSHRNVLILCAVSYALLIFMIMYQVYLKEYTIAYYTYFWFLLIPLCLETAYAFLNNLGCWNAEKHRYARYLKSQKYADFEKETSGNYIESEPETTEPDEASTSEPEEAAASETDIFASEITYPGADEDLSDETAFLDLGKNLGKELNKVNAEQAVGQPDNDLENELFEQVIDDSEHTSWIAGELEEIRSMDQDNELSSDPEEDEDSKLSREFDAFFDDDDE